MRNMSAHNLYRYSHTIGFYGLGGRGFNNPVDVAIRRDGMLYVLNRAGTEIDVRMGYKRVSMCTLAEEYHGDFSGGGTGGGQLDRKRGVWGKRGDLGGGRILKKKKKKKRARA